MGAQVRVDAVLAVERVAFDEVEFLVGAEALAQGFGKVAVDLDGDDLARPREQLLGQRARPRAHLDHDVVGPDLAGLGDEAHQVLVDHEVLPEPLPRLRAGLGQDRLDLVLRLRHARRRVYRRAALCPLSNRPARTYIAGTSTLP